MERRKVAACIILFESQKKKLKNKKKRTCWVRDWLKQRQEKSAYANILSELRLSDREEFRRYLRMNSETYTIYIFSLLFSLFRFNEKVKILAQTLFFTI